MALPARRLIASPCPPPEPMVHVAAKAALRQNSSSLAGVCGLWERAFSFPTARPVSMMLILHNPANQAHIEDLKDRLSAQLAQDPSDLDGETGIPAVIRTLVQAVQAMDRGATSLRRRCPANLQRLPRSRLQLRALAGRDGRGGGPSRGDSPRSRLTWTRELRRWPGSKSREDGRDRSSVQPAQGLALAPGPSRPRPRGLCRDGHLRPRCLG